MTDTPETGAGAQGGAGSPWHAGLSPEAFGFQAGDPGKAEMSGYLVNRGYDKMDPAAAFAAAVKAHRAAEAHLGAPSDQLLRMPKDGNDAEGWSRVAQRLNVPTDPKEYDFSAVKVGENPMDEKLAEVLRPVLKSALVGKDRAPEVAKAVSDFYAQRETAAAADRATKLAAERVTLAGNWGANAEANMIVAKNAAKALGVSEEAVAALENTIGYAKVMEMFRNIGTRIGEDSFVVNGAPGGSGVMSSDQAAATLATKQQDQAWVSKLMNGDSDVVKEFDQLTRMVNADQRRQ